MPIKPKRISFTPHTPDADGICAAQQAAGAGALTLNGADVSGGVARFAASGQTLRVGYQVGIASAGNLAAVNFTVVGTAPGGAALSETIAGPNNNTVETTGYFETVTSVTVDGAVGSNVTVGTVDEFATSPIPVDVYCQNTTLAADISGTINYTVQACYERVTAGETPNWSDAIAAGAVDAAFVVEGNIGAVRVVGNSFTGGATIALTVSQPRYN
jgi:hypothetical protein